MVASDFPYKDLAALLKAKLAGCGIPETGRGGMAAKIEKELKRTKPTGNAAKKWLTGESRPDQSYIRELSKVFRFERKEFDYWYSPKELGYTREEDPHLPPPGGAINDEQLRHIVELWPNVEERWQTVIMMIINTAYDAGNERPSMEA